MSNKIQLQTNNTKVASLIEVLQSKAIPSGEDVAAETNAYTTKIASLETAITALEEELQGKASGGSCSVETCTVEFSFLSSGISEFQITTSTLDSMGKITSNTVLHIFDSPELVIENVVCGSVIAITYTAYEGGYGRMDHMGDFSDIHFQSYDNGMALLTGAPNKSGTYTLTVID